jgi:hypothetical protein
VIGDNIEQGKEYPHHRYRMYDEAIAPQHKPRGAALWVSSFGISRPEVAEGAEQRSYKR